MAGIKLVTDAEPERALELAWRAAQDLSFKLTPIADGTFQASKGRALWSALVGPASPHCRFRITAKKYPDGTTDLVLERNTPWTSGVLGLRRLNAEAEALMQKAAEAIQQGGARIIERKEI
jgi:hypothetical protein